MNVNSVIGLYISYLCASVQ